MTQRLPVTGSRDIVRRHSGAINRALQKTGPLSFDGALMTVGTDWSLDTGYTYKINNVQVVGPRETGWTADTGTASKAAQATYTAGTTLTFTDPPTAGEMTALATRLVAIEAALQATTQGKKALKDALILHGLLGA